MQVSRLFEIIYILLNKKTTTAKELAAHFGVSTRTIYRDVDTLSLAGIPVYTEKGKNGGISLLPDFVLNKSILSEREQNEILAALHGLSHVNAGEANGVLNRLSTIFNKTAANWLEVDFSDWGYTNDLFTDFKTAILERRIAAFDYYNTYGEKTFRRVEPMQLWFKSRAWYVKAFCLAKMDMRLYKLTRVRNLTITHEHFPVRDLLASAHNGQTSPSTQGYSPTIPLTQEHNQVSPTQENAEKRDKEHTKERENITVKLRISPEMTYRVYDDFDESIVEKQPDGSFIVTSIYPDDNWIYNYVLSYAEYAEVVTPPHLREIIKEKARKIYKKYL